MTINENSITLVNHASVLIKGPSKVILTDPWFDGDVFHYGWRLLYENETEQIENILDETDYIWISHEHPDHFSIGFFKRYKNQILSNGIQIIFQETEDGRVIDFLRKEGLPSIELASEEIFDIEPGFSIKIIRDQYYDSALVADLGGKIIFNLNDCPILSRERIGDFQKRHGNCDVLLTQFSYAAWKGGRENKSWRELAASEKINGLVNQGNMFGAKVVIPFASFVWFSNELNYYLNDSVNTPQRVLDHCSDGRASFDCLFLKPYEVYSMDAKPVQKRESIEFWEGRYKQLTRDKCGQYRQTFNLDLLHDLFGQYCERIRKNNSWWIIRLIGGLNFLGGFQPVVIKLGDLEDSIIVDLPRQVLRRTDKAPDVLLHSESLAFIFRNAFGFDTLTVNGTFEEVRHGGFGRFAKTFAVENLNNLGYSIKPALIFNLKLISIFLGRLTGVARKLK
jgi:UDP-MurNAc hydroxylase